MSSSFPVYLWRLYLFTKWFNFKWSEQPFDCFFLFFRFWWEAEGVFTQQQKAELLKGSLSQIICDNTDIREVPADSFRLRKYPSGYISCDCIQSMTLEAWREEKSQGSLVLVLTFNKTTLFHFNFIFPLHINMKHFYHSIPDLEQCGTPRTIQNGDFILSSLSGKLVAQYSCYHGFKLRGAAAIVCEGKQWSGQPPQCTSM